MAFMSAFLTVALVHLLAVASPGPDFALAVKNAVSGSRRGALWTCAGIAVGILVHVTYCLLGIGLVISRSIVLFTTIKWIGALYLMFIGWKALTAKASRTAIDRSGIRREQAWHRWFLEGFLCNALNPKATIFFLALFTQVISPATPLWTQAFYGLYMTTQTFVWFAGLSLLLDLPPVRETISRLHGVIDRVMGGILIALGLKVAFATRD